MDDPATHMQEKALAEVFVTVGDLLRYGVSRFGAAKLTYGHGTQDALAEASFLIMESLNLPHERLELFLDARLTLAEKAQCLELIEQRITTRKPAAYLIGKAFIGGVPFYVDERVIVPRSFLAHILQSDLISGAEHSLIRDGAKVGGVLDLCTGSGCIAILAAAAFPHAKVDAVDLSADALEVARINVAARPERSRIRLMQGNLFEPVAGERYDLIVTNPPYVDADSMAQLPLEYRHEPRMALAGGPDGLDLVRRIVRDAPRHLLPGGGLLCEFGRGREILEGEFPDLPFRWLANDSCFFIGALDTHAGQTTCRYR